MRLGGVEPAGEQHQLAAQDAVLHGCAELVALVRPAVHVRHEEVVGEGFGQVVRAEGGVGFLECEPLPDGAEVVAHVQHARGLDS